MTEAKQPTGWPKKFQANRHVYFRPTISKAVGRWWNGSFPGTIGLHPETFIDAIVAGPAGAI